MHLKDPVYENELSDPSTKLGVVTVSLYVTQCQA